MDNFEFNKIFAAILCAGITAYLGAFIAGKLVYPEKLKKNAVEIEGSAVASSGPAKPKLPDPILSLIATADLEKGAKLSKACAACHSFDQGGPHKVGPNLHNIVGAPKAGKDGFAYSGALADMGGAWGYENLNKFLWKPKAYVSGTKMNYNGMKKPEQRAALIAWMRAQSASPLSLPTDAEIAAEIAELAPPEEEANTDAEEKTDEKVEETATEAPADNTAQ